MYPPRPPLWFLAALAAMAALDALFPAPRVDGPAATAVGVGLILLGLGLIGRCALIFRRRRANIDTFREPTALIEEGPFRATRNPIYLGFVIALLGAAALFGSLAALAPVAAFWALANWWWIPFEERNMAARFGADYDAYRARVRRWI